MSANDCRLARLDPLAFGWAAGFFDGEGSTIIHEPRLGYLRLTVSVPQFGGVEPPAVLHRFKEAMLGLGKIDPLNDEGMWAWRSRSTEEGQAAIAFMWSQLGPVKREQASSAIRRIHAQYGPGRLKPRSSKRVRPTHSLHDPVSVSDLPSTELRLAWLAGFFDGEGCFCLVRATKARKNGPVWSRIRASITQRSERTGPPEVLLRVRDILGFGRIERHGDPHAYKWVTEGEERVATIVSATAGWLGRVKVDQATAALNAFRVQVRLKGDATHCRRGHKYTRVTRRKNGYIHSVCNACDRILRRGQRAAKGIKPRRFRNAARRYTF